MKKDDRYSMTFKEAKIGPNKKQFAIAQYLAIAVKDDAHPRLVC